MRRSVLLSVAVLVTVLCMSPASAHPFGPPPQATVSSEGSTVTVVWSAEPDDLFNLGQATGALAGRQVFVFDGNEPVDPGGGAASIDEQLSTAPEIRDYLGANIEVRQDATGCALGAVDIREVNDTGARLTYDCRRPVDLVELEITALTDLDPAYRTVATGTNGARTLHTAAEPVQTLALAGGRGATSGPPLPVLVGALGVLAALAALVWRRRRSPVPR